MRNKIMKQQNPVSISYSPARMFLIVCMAILSLAQTALGQWSTSGNDIYNNNSGNVGIGTSSPAQKLDVSGGAVRIADTEAYLWLTSTGGGAGTWGVLGSTGYSVKLFRIYDLDNGVDRFNITASGNVGIGTTTPSSKLHVNGDVTVTGNISAKYQDLAEWVPARHAIAPATVVVLDPSEPNTVVSSSESYDTRVAGVVSAEPGIVLGEAGEGKVKIATTGRVKVRVDATKAPIRIGDLLVTSDRQGVAMRSEPIEIGGRKIHQPGTLIGKALEPLAEGDGEILVLLSLQ
jgi:hypothetical protein